MKSKKIPSGILSSIFFLCSLLLYSCEPKYCAWCYEKGTIHVGREMEICVDYEEDLWILIEQAEAMGYECELKDSDD